DPQWNVFAERLRETLNRFPSDKLRHARISVCVITDFMQLMTAGRPSLEASANVLGIMRDDILDGFSQLEDARTVEQRKRAGQHIRKAMENFQSTWNMCVQGFVAFHQGEIAQK